MNSLEALIEVTVRLPLLKHWDQYKNCLHDDLLTMFSTCWNVLSEISLQGMTVYNCQARGFHVFLYLKIGTIYNEEERPACILLLF